MGHNEFTYWLKGFFELTDSKTLTPEQVGMIKEQLHLVFIKVAEVRTKPTPPPTKMLREGEDPRKIVDWKDAVAKHHAEEARQDAEKAKQSREKEERKAQWVFTGLRI